jgi:hypothetical protein
LEVQKVAAPLSATLKELILDRLASQGRIERKGTHLVPPGGQAGPTPEQQLADRILGLYAATGFNSPRPEDVPALLQVAPGTVEPVLRMLVSEGRLVQVSAKVILTREHLMEAQKRVVAAIQKQGQLDSGDFKFMIDSTRKYALAILEHMDRTHVTIRLDSLRKLAPNYEKTDAEIGYGKRTVHFLRRVVASRSGISGGGGGADPQGLRGGQRFRRRGLPSRIRSRLGRDVHL